MEKGVVYRGEGAFDRVFRALGDPHRIQIINLLRERELSAGEILEQIDVVQSTLSHHMKTLSDSGVVNTLRHGKWTYYTLNESIFADASKYLAKCAEGTRIRKEEGKSQDESDVKKKSSGGDDSVKRTSAKGTDTVKKASSGYRPDDHARVDKDRPGGTQQGTDSDSRKPGQEKNRYTVAGTGEKSGEKNTEKSGKKKDKKNKKNKKKK